MVFAQQGPHLAEAGRGLGAAADDGGDVGVVVVGEQKAVAAGGLQDDDVGSDMGVQRVGGMQRGDRGHGEVVAAARDSGVSVGCSGRQRRRLANTSRAMDAGRLGRECMGAAPLRW